MDPPVILNEIVSLKQATWLVGVTVPPVNGAAIKTSTSGVASSQIIPPGSSLIVTLLNSVETAIGDVNT